MYIVLLVICVSCVIKTTRYLLFKISLNYFERKYYELSIFKISFKYLIFLQNIKRLKTVKW